MTAKLLFKCAALLAVVGSAQGAPVYRAMDMGLVSGSNTTRIFDINDRADGIGISGSQWVKWSVNAGLTLIPEPGNEDKTFALRVVNKARTSAGSFYSGDKREAILVKADRSHLFFLTGTWAADTLAPVEPIRDLSNSGNVLGVSAFPWIWSEQKGLREIGVGKPASDYIVNRLNDSGQVVGYSIPNNVGDGCDGTRAFLYEDQTGEFTALDGGPADVSQEKCYWFSEATAINKSGQAVGYSNRLHDPVDPDSYFPFIWSKIRGGMALKNTDPKKIDFIPLDINERGQVVGTFKYKSDGALKDRHFFYWDAASGIVDLQDILDSGDAFSQTVSLHTDQKDAKINAAGVILAAGKVTGDKATHSFLLFPH